uniref:hypothetical protein n=1 Tax=Vibrio sp. St2 TaxID=2853441 RepID=UPI00248F22D1
TSVMAGYKDVSGQAGVGADLESVVQPVLVMPEIADLLTGSDGAKALMVSGTSLGFKANTNLSVVIESDNGVDSMPTLVAPVATDGTWSTTAQNLSGWKSGTLTIKVSGKNGEPGKQQTVEASQDVILSD